MIGGFVKKRCPKCGGNIYLDKDFYGWYEECLQCSHSRHLETIIEVGEKVGKVNLKWAEGNTRLQ